MGVHSDSTRIAPLVYALMWDKSKENYTKLFEEIVDFASDIDDELAPQLIIQDFKQHFPAARRCFP